MRTQSRSMEGLMSEILYVCMNQLVSTPSWFYSVPLQVSRFQSRPRPLHSLGQRSLSLFPCRRTQGDLCTLSQETIFRIFCHFCRFKPSSHVSSHQLHPHHQATPPPHHPHSFTKLPLTSQCTSQPYPLRASSNQIARFKIQFTIRYTRGPPTRQLVCCLILNHTHFTRRGHVIPRLLGSVSNGDCS